MPHGGTPYGGTPYGDGEGGSGTLPGSGTGTLVFAGRGGGALTGRGSGFVLFAGSGLGALVGRHTLTMPVVQGVTPRFDFDAEHRPVPTTRLQRALYKYMRPLDRETNIYVLSDGTVVTDIPVPLSNDQMSSTAVPYPITAWGTVTPGTVVGPPEGAEGGPFGPPPPYAVVQDNVTGSASGGTYTAYQLSPYLKYIFLGGHGPYHNLSANLVSLLTAAHFDTYLT